MSRLTETIDPEWTLAELCPRLETQALTSAQLLSFYLDRIEALDRSGPKLRSILYLNPKALEEARILDKERRGGTIRGPLHGIPVLLKGNINTGDSQPTSAGSLALENFFPPEAPLVSRLRAAGAIILGKTNLSEWANFRSSHSSSGWSSSGGQTKNPYVLDRSPSGSSSGSAVALAAGLCPLAVGTETDGSIVSPASANGIVGFKPSRGLVSTEGIVPISHTQDTAGPMARTVADTVLLFAVLAGRDPGELLGPSFPEGLYPLRIGYAHGLARFLPSVQNIMEGAVATLETLGARVVPIDLEIPEAVSKAEYQVLLYEFKHDLEAYLQAYGAPFRSLEELIRYNEAHGDRILRYFGQDILIEAQAQGPQTEQKYRDALELCARFERERGIGPAMAAHRLDAIVGPSGGPAWKIDHLLGDHYLGGSALLPALSGYPHLSVPAGLIGELPVGLSIFGLPHTETTLFRIGRAFEKAQKGRRRPRFLPTDPE